VIGHVDEQDRVLRDQAHEHDDPDHRRHAEVVAGDQDREQRSDDGQWQRQHDEERLEERLEL
jgi:hypothetical protein